MNHTQGKWEVEEYKGLFTVVTDGEPICVFYLLQEEDHHYQEFENAEANARLIAAAPDLLEACKDAKKVIYEAINKRKSNLPTVWHALEAVITKAEQK